MGAAVKINCSMWDWGHVYETILTKHLYLCFSYRKIFALDDSWEELEACRFDAAIALACIFTFFLSILELVVTHIVGFTLLNTIWIHFSLSLLVPQICEFNVIFSHTYQIFIFGIDSNAFCVKHVLTHNNFSWVSRLKIPRLLHFRVTSITCLKFAFYTLIKYHLVFFRFQLKYKQV